jgi:3-polyprenyl-4-hydroxybenzoate decarboxylase
MTDNQQYQSGFGPQTQGRTRLTALRMKPSGSKPAIDATKKLPGENFKHPWPPLIKMDAAVKAKVGKLYS